MNLQVHFDIPSYLFVLFGLVSAVFAYLMYRKLEVVSVPRRMFLGTLRWASLFLLFLAMTNLVTDLVRSEYKKKDVFLLVDDSKSMSLKDASMPRPEAVRDVLKSAPFDTLRRYFKIKPIVFGENVLPDRDTDSLRFGQAATNISAAVSQSIRMDDQGEAAFAILISDGDYNKGGNPIELARDLTFPMYVIGVGDSTSPKDVVVRQVIPAPAIYAGKKSVVRALIGSNGYGLASATAYLSDDGREVASKTVTLPERGDVEVSFDYTPLTVGTHLLKVYVPPLSGELSRRNNSASVTADVQKGKYSILLVAGAPATDVAFIRRNIEANGDFELRLLVQKTGDTFYQKGAAAILAGSYDAAVLNDFPNSRSALTMKEVISKLNADELPYAYFAGAGFSARNVGELPRLPFKISSYSSGEYQVGISPEAGPNMSATLQPIYSLVESNSSMFPPLYYQMIECLPSPGSEPIASPVINGVKSASPVFLVDPAGRSAAFLAYGLWRLQLMSPLSGVRSDFLQEFLTTLMRTLISSGKQKLLTVRTDKSVYDPSEAIHFSALLVGQGGKPLDGANVDLAINDRSGKKFSDIRLSSVGGGAYTGAVSGLGEGRYEYVADATYGSTFAGADSGSVSVEPLNVEYVQTAMNVSLLKQIASVSGGAFYTPSQFIKNGINLEPSWKKPTKLLHSSSFELLSSLPILALVFVLLAVEWTVRKLWGLP